MKKVLLIVIVALLTIGMCSCGKVKCGLCGEEVSSMSAKKNEALGEEIYVCKDCYEELNDLYEAFN